MWQIKIKKNVRAMNCSSTKEKKRKEKPPPKGME
jgi:hypothetical protein